MWYNSIMKNEISTNTISMDVEQAADKYMTLKAEIEALEEQKKLCKEVLETAVKESPDMRISLEMYEILLSDCSRESCDLKAAKKELGDILTPFIKTSTYTQLRVTKK